MCSVFSFVLWAVAAALPCAGAAPISSSDSPQRLADPTYGPVPGQSPLYNDYTGKAPPFPGNITDPILPTANGEPGLDDNLFQNLLAAEWVIFSFYQQGVEAFNESVFVEADYPNTTYAAITTIRDNEAGHLRIFQDQISPVSVKPGPCKYEFPFYDATTFLALATDIEVSSMAFISGLALQARLSSSKSALVAIAETETRHNVWSLLEIWGVSPFAGPSDTVFPYANEILDTTNAFIVPGSCPALNPTYPYPRQNLPALGAANGTKSLSPGAHIVYNFTEPTNQPKFNTSKEYYAVFFHGVANITVPFNTTDNSSTIPSSFDSNAGVIITVIADTPGAPTLDTVIAGPGIILEQPAPLGVLLAS